MKTPRTVTQWIVLAAGAAVLGGYMASGVVRRMARERHIQEFAGAPAAYSTATVLSVVREGGSQTGSSGGAWALVRFRGRIYTARSAVEPELLQPGQEARIVYRTGRSGRIAIERVEPLSVRPMGPGK
ncbi:MAG: hypothetical protein ACP5VE_07065 [Chthonomonadales bacterium]